MTNYKNGRAVEYRVRDKLQLVGYIVFRPGGSRGAADLIAFDTNGDPVLIQVKKNSNGTISPAERGKLLALARLCGNAVPVVAYRPAPRKPIAWRELTGPGPKDWQPWTPDEVAP
jgi:hypothetical protein